MSAPAGAIEPAGREGRRRPIVPLATPFLLGGIVVVLAAAASLGSTATDRTLIVALVNVLLVVGLYAFVGNSGIFSFGHMAFMAVGAYVAALLVIPPAEKRVIVEGIPDWVAGLQASAPVATVAAGLAAAVLAAAVSLPVMRLSGLAASIATFAILVIVYVVAANWTEVTNGRRGMTGVPTTTTVVGCVLWVLVAIGLVYGFQTSRWGLRLRATREDEVAARALGIGVLRERRLGLVLSAFLFGIGGALYAQFIGAFTPDSFFIASSFTVIAMLVVGGIGSLTGAVLGSIVISALAEGLRRLEGGFSLGVVDVGPRLGLQEVGLATAMVLVLILRPAGLTAGRELTWPASLRVRR